MSKKNNNKKYQVMLLNKSGIILKKVETDFRTEAESAYYQFCNFQSVRSGYNMAKIDEKR